MAAGAVATARFDDGIPRGLACRGAQVGTRIRSEASWRSRKRSPRHVGPKDLDFVELQDNTVYYELAFPRGLGPVPRPARPSA
ncbi:MAG: hypothetical protein U0610_07405 [bacterium]